MGSLEVSLLRHFHRYFLCCNFVTSNASDTWHSTAGMSCWELVYVGSNPAFDQIILCLQELKEDRKVPFGFFLVLCNFFLEFSTPNFTLIFSRNKRFASIEAPAPVLRFPGVYILALCEHCRLLGPVKQGIGCEKALKKD